MTTRRIRLCITAIIIASSILMARTVRALADDGPSPEETPVVTPADVPAETAAPTEEVAPPEPTPDPEQTAAPDPTGDPAAEPTEEATPAEETPVPTDAAEPETTEEPADEGGEDTTVYSDPIWCPVSASPGDAACTPPQPTITDLIAYLRANSATYNGDGAIYFMVGDYAGTESYIVIDCTVLPDLGALAISGGWDLGGSNNQTGVTNFTVPVRVVWDDPVTISDIVVTLPTGSPEVGLRVSSNGDIVVDNVVVQGGSYGGLLTSGGSVSVTGSVFNQSTNTGLTVYADDDVTLTDVYAQNNNSGIVVDNTRGTGDVVVDSVFVTGNNWTGLDVRSAGNVGLTDVTASDNLVGAYVQATYGGGNVTVTGGTYEGNSDVGIKAITTTGNITLTNVFVDGMGEPGSTGAWLKSMAGGTIDIVDSSFVNSQTGLFVVGTGPVNLNNVTVDNNTGNGAKVVSGWVWGCFGPDGIPVTVTGGTVSNSGGIGLVIYPGINGSVTIIGTVFTNNPNGDYDIDLTKACNPAVEKPSKPYQVVEVTGKGDDPKEADCTGYSGLMMILPDQSRVKMGCPIPGETTVAKVEPEDLPGKIPGGMDVVGAITVDNSEVEILPEGSWLQVCFAIPEDMLGRRFAIMYWDPTANGGAGAWIELPRNQFGGQIFPLHADTPEDGMLILEGVYRCGSSECVKVNFTGTFALVAL
jgi:hypothetical protein